MWYHEKKCKNIEINENTEIINVNIQDDDDERALYHWHDDDPERAELCSWLWLCV